MSYRALFSLRPLCRRASNSCTALVRHASSFTSEQNSLNYSKPSFLNSQRQLLPIVHLEQQMQKIKIEELPTLKMTIECPRNTLLNQIYDIIKENNIEEPEPAANKLNEIQAARLIVIRRRKMKKHKLKKLRKKMKFEWAKVRQRREMRKEKAFQAELLTQIRLAEKFSAAQYVEEKLQQANENPIPRFWKGKRLPQFIIKEKLGIK